MEKVAESEANQVKEGGKYVNRRRRSLLAELSAKGGGAQQASIMNDEELAWASDAMGGVDLSKPLVLYDMDDDLERRATTWLDSCAKHELKGGKEMLVVVVELNTGRKVVATTEVGWNFADAGYRDDHHAALYEVTGRHVWRVGEKYAHAINVQNGPATYRAASFGLRGIDFHLDSRLSTGAEHTGSCLPGRTLKYFKTAAMNRDGGWTSIIHALV